MQLSLNWVDISIVVAYLLACIIIGYSRSNTVKNLKEYAVGNRSITTIALITSVFATKIGAGATMGEIERVFNVGMIFAASLAFTPLYWFITAKLFAGRIDKFRNCISLTDIMRRLYGKPGQWFTVFASLIDSLGSVSAQLSAIGFLLEYLAGVPYIYGAAFGGLLVCTYVTFGGAKSVVLTDVFQFIIFYAVMPIACVLAVRASGGIENIISNLPSELIAFKLEGENFWRFVTYSFYILLPATSATFVQRFLMSKNSTQLAHSLYSIALISIPFALILGVIGFTIKSLAPDIQGNHAFYFLIANYLPVGVIGLAISAVFAIIMSSANSWLNSGATIISNDIIRHFKPNMTDTQGLWYARLATIGITIASIMLAIWGGSVIKILWFSDSFWFPVMLVPMIAGLYGVHSNSTVFTISAVSAIFASASAAAYYGEFNPICVCLGILGSLSGFLISHTFSFRRTKLIKSSALFKALNNSLNFDCKTVATNFFSSNKANSLNYITFCIFAIYQYIPSIFNTAIDPSGDFEVIIYLQVTVIVMALFLFTFESWNEKVRYYLAPILWYFTIFFALSFIPILLLIIKTDKNLWVINLLLSMILLITFMRISSSAYILIAGAMAAYLLSGFFQGTAAPTAIEIIHTFSPLAYGLVGIFLIYVIKSGFEKRESELSDNAKFVAHEAISPLAVVNMSADTFSKILSDAKFSKNGDMVNLPKDQWELLTNVASKLADSSKAGIRRVNNILKSKNNDYADIAYYQISEIIDEVVTEFASQQITVETIKAFIFFGSKEALKTVLSNLIRNAIKYAGQNAKITITIDDKIIVSDNGIGIDPKILPHIFNKKITSTGHGFGLSICKKIIEAHGGNITVSSKSNKGTIFEIKFS